MYLLDTEKYGHFISYLIYSDYFYFFLFLWVPLAHVLDIHFNIDSRKDYFRRKHEITGQ